MHDSCIKHDNVYPTNTKLDDTRDVCSVSEVESQWQSQRILLDHAVHVA